MTEKVVIEVKLDLLIGMEKNMGLVPLVVVFVTCQNSVEIYLLHLVIVEKEVNPELDQKKKGKDTKKHTSEGSSSRRRSTSSNPRYTDSSTSTHDFYPPGSGQSSYSQPPHGYYPFPNYDMPMPYQPQMYPPPPMYQSPPPPPMYQPPPSHMYPPVPPQLFENQGENVTFFGYIFGQRPQSQRSSQDTSQAEGEGEGGSDAYDLPRYSTNW
ncbi:hypothetical protein V6N13_058976 [Hibiscus sabdariffa]